MTMAPTRKQAARTREEATPFVDEVTARGVSREEMPTQAPPTMPEDSPPGVSEINPGYMRLYKRVDYGWKPTIVSRGSVEACVESGSFRFECGDCGEHCGPGPNDCEGRAKMKFTRCPVVSCRKPLYDTAEDDDAPSGGGEDDPNEIKLIANASTAEARLRVKLNRHLRFAHLSTAEEMGVANDPFMVPGAHAIANAMQPAVPFPVHPAERGV